jgi:hypothetical protein
VTSFVVPQQTQDRVSSITATSPLVNCDLLTSILLLTRVETSAAFV